MIEIAILDNFRSTARNDKAPIDLVCKLDIIEGIEENGLYLKQAKIKPKK